MFLVEIEARLTWLDLAADRGRHAPPGSLDLGKIFGNRADRAILLDELADNVVERFEQALVNLHVPVAMGHDIVTGASLRLGRGGELVLFTLRGDVVDVNFNFVFLAPLVADFGEGTVGAGYPMIPAAQRKLSRCVSTPHIRSGDARREGEGGIFQHGSASSA